MRKIVVALLLIGLLSSSGIASNHTDNSLLEEETIQLPIDREKELSPRIENRLSVNDTIKIELSGRAITERLVSWEITETSDITCNSDQTACNVSIDGQSSRKMLISMQGAMVGQGNFIMKGTSKRTQLSAEDTIQISTVPTTQSGIKEASGVGILHILFLMLLGGTAYFVMHRP